MSFKQDPLERRGRLDKTIGPQLTAPAGRSAQGGLSHAPSTLDQPRCKYCNGTGYAPNCTADDRSRSDLWACLICCGTRILES